MTSSTSQSVMDTLVRVSPDQFDGRGLRVVRHVGPGACVISRVDPRGRLLRQELVLGKEVIIWQHGTRLRTGLLSDGGEPSNAKFDHDPSRMRVDRARQAVERYSGPDKYVRHLSRAVQMHAGFEAADLVTDSPSQRKRRRKKQGLPTVPITVLAVSTFLAVFLALRLIG